MYKYITSIFLLLPFVASANTTLDNLNKAAEGTGLKTDQSPIEIIVSIINVILYFVGTIFMVLIIWAGFKWMTAAGNTDSIKKARETIVNSVIGLIIIFASYAIVNFVIGSLVDISGAGSTVPPAGSGS